MAENIMAVTTDGRVNSTETEDKAKDKTKDKAKEQHKEKEPKERDLKDNVTGVAPGTITSRSVPIRTLGSFCKDITRKTPRESNNNNNNNNNNNKAAEDKREEHFLINHDYILVGI